MLPKMVNSAKWICCAFVLLVLFRSVLPERTSHPVKAITSPAPSYSRIDSSVPYSESTANKPMEVLSGGGSESNAVSAGQFTNQQNESYKYNLLPNLRKDMSRYTAVEVVATGYYAGKESTGKNPGHPEYGVTFSGMKVQRDKNSFSTIAADPAVFPLGSVLYIPGYGYGVVADTGSAIKGNRIDLYFETKDQVYNEWGKKTLNVFVVKKGDGKITSVMWNELQTELLL